MTWFECFRMMGPCNAATERCGEKSRYDTICSGSSGAGAATKSWKKSQKGDLTRVLSGKCECIVEGKKGAKSQSGAGMVRLEGKISSFSTRLPCTQVRSGATSLTRRLS